MKKEIEETPENLKERCSTASGLERQIFRKIERLMQKERAYMNPKINRVLLAAMVGTNSTYVGNAIRKMTGKHTHEYIAEYRLNAAQAILESNPFTPPHTIIKKCGFPSKSTFYRKFAKYYQQSPKKYRPSTGSDQTII